MTKALVTIGVDQTLEHAKRVIYAESIRHLPVLNGGKLVGVISDRDIKLAYAVDGARAKDLKVGDASSGEVYSVTAECPLKDVAHQMAERSIGCTIIQDGHGKVIGIFTATDACKVLSQMA